MSKAAHLQETRRVRRRFREFFDLHDHLAGLRPAVHRLDFPMRRPSIYETIHSVNDRRVRLEKYLRRVAGLLYSARLHRSGAQIAEKLQDFLDVPTRRESLELLERNPDATLRQAAQVAAYQILALPALDKILTEIVASAAQHQFDSGVGMLVKMKEYIDHLQSVVMQGCCDFLRDVVLRRVTVIAEEDLAVVVTSAVRRQIETEIFVPLMEKLHALLGVDIAQQEHLVRYKCAQLRRRPQTFCGIPLDHISPSSWESAIYHLGSIDAYTLPCDKLDALLAAAKEIPTLYAAEHPGTDVHLGADDFLPIFIYVLINADISELCYLQKVLCTVCDPGKRLSETGYYVATFEAAVQHILEMELD